MVAPISVEPAKELVGDRDPRQHEFSIELRAFDSAKRGNAVGIGTLLALCSGLLQKSIKGGMVVDVVELAIEKGEGGILMPVSSRRQVNDLPDDLAAKITVLFYLHARDALLKALAV